MQIARALSLPFTLLKEVKAGIYSAWLKLEKQHNMASPAMSLLFVNILSCAKKILLKLTSQYNWS